MPPQEFVRTAIWQEVEGLAMFAIGVTFVIVMLIGDPDRSAGLIQFSIALVVFPALMWILAWRRVTDNLDSTKALPATARLRTGLSAFGKPLTRLALLVVVFSVVVAIDTTLTGLVAGVAVGAGSGLLALARWLRRWERGMRLSVLHEATRTRRVWDKDDITSYGYDARRNITSAYVC